MKQSKQNFLEAERRAYINQVEDLRTSLEINKSIICDLLQSKNFSKAFETSITSKCIDEVNLLTNRNKQY